MKNTLIIILVFALNFAGFSQEKVEVIKNTRRTYVNEKLYFLHTVKKGENLFAICKAYNVLQKEVAIENPEVFDGLKLGQVIKIPVLNDGFGSIGADLFIIHKVNGGETLSAISRLYNVKVKKIKAANPGLGDNLKIGQVIRIAKKDVKNLSEATANIDENYIIHIVQKKETLYSLSKQYDVSIDVIKKENPMVEAKGLQPDMRIKFPKKKIAIETVVLNDTTLTDSLVVKIDSCLAKQFDKSKEYKIALLLPFNIDEKQLWKEEKAKSSPNFMPKNKPFVEFYEGMLSATDSLRKEGFSLKYFVYDYSNDSLSKTNTLKNIAINNVDLIIGPAYSSNFKHVADFAKENKTPIISPFADISSVVKTNEYAIQIYSNTNKDFGKFAKIITDTSSLNFIIIYDNKEKEKATIAHFKNQIFSTLATDSLGSNISYRENIYTKKGIAGIKNSLSADTNNLIIITTYEQAKISDIITKISVVSKDYENIILFGLPSWNNFKGLDYNYFHKLNKMSLKSQYVDYSNEDVKRYVYRFRKKFKNDPTTYTFLGYDIVNHFVKTIATYDNIECINKYESKGLTTGFKLIKSGEGYTNNSLYIIKFTPEFDVESSFVE